MAPAWREPEQSSYICASIVHSSIDYSKHSFFVGSKPSRSYIHAYVDFDIEVVRHAACMHGHGEVDKLHNYQ